MSNPKNNEATIFYMVGYQRLLNTIRRSRFGVIVLVESKSNGTAAKPASQYKQSVNKQSGKKGKAKTKEGTKRQSMLNTHKISPFKYDMNEVLSATAMDPSKASAFLASVIAKASRVSTKDAKDFVKTFLESGDLTKEEYDKISRLMDKYSKYR